MTTILNDTRRDDYFKSIAALARAEGEGANSRPAFGRETFIAASDGVIIGGKEEGNDVAKVHNHYQTNVAKKFSGTPALQDDASLKVQHSKLRTIMTVGGLPIFRTRTDGTSPASEYLQVFDDVISSVQAATKRNVPVYDKLVSVCRAQKKKPERMLTRDEIAAAVNPEKADPEELKTLRRLAASLRKLGEQKHMLGAAECLENAAMALAPRMAYLEEIEKGSALVKSIEAMPEGIREAAMAAYNEKLAALEAAQSE